MSFLRQTQNQDGGWGYFPGKGSWLEPTVYASLALNGTPVADSAAKLVWSWQGADGAWRPSHEVEVATSGTALALTLAAARGEFGASTQRGVQWLLGNYGAESGVSNILLRWCNKERNEGLKGWPWKPGTSAWVEPTARAIVALKKNAAKFPSKELTGRLVDGEAQLLDIRCPDGGWNYGSPSALGIPLPSYPETTGLALVGLQGNPKAVPALDHAAKLLMETPSPLAKAWLTIALRLQGREVPEPVGEPSRDIMITALEALAVKEGNYRAFQTGANA